MKVTFNEAMNTAKAPSDADLRPDVTGTLTDRRQLDEAGTIYTATYDVADANVLCQT